MIVERNRRAKLGESGFTLLELLVVLAMLAAIACLSFPMLRRPSESARLEAAARNLIGALRATRMGAISRGKELTLVIDADARSFHSEVAARQVIDPDIRVRAVVAKDEQITQTRGRFRFYPDGSSSGGDIQLLLNERDSRICVDWLTGLAQQKADVADRTIKMAKRC